MSEFPQDPTMVAPLRLRCWLSPSARERRQWDAALRRHDPTLQIEHWQPGDPPDPQVRLALAWQPPQAFIDAHPGLAVLFNAGAGVDGLLGLSWPPGLQLVRLEDAGMGAQMREYVVLAALSHLRDFGHYARQQAQGRWQPRGARQAAGCTVGILGLGVLGQQVAQGLQALGFPVRGWVRRQDDAPPGGSRGQCQRGGVPVWQGRDELDDFLAGVGFLVVLLPLTDATRGLLDGARLRRLAPGAGLVNVARGAIVVAADLTAALDDGHLARAWLDVFETEPLPPGHPWWQHPAVVVTPHIAAATIPEQAAAQVVAGCHAHRAGQPLAGRVDRDRGY